jgi:hypothetical protein
VGRGGYQFSVGVIAFHEKAGTCQEQFSFSPYCLSGPPLPLPFHPHSLMSEVRSVPVGRSRFSRCCHLIIDLASVFRIEGWARRFSQSPELGGRNSAIRILILRLTLLRSVQAGYVAAHRPHHSPTVDEAEWTTFAPPPPRLVSWHSCLRAPPASDPSVADCCRLQRGPESGARFAPSSFVSRDLLSC